MNVRRAENDVPASAGSTAVSMLNGTLNVSPPLNVRVHCSPMGSNDPSS